MDTLTKPITTLKRTKQVHSNWYREQYPDVAALGMEPAEHYLKYGAAMGRNPGKNFDTRFYLETHPEVADSGINPLLHYALFGEQNGYARRGTRRNSHQEARARIGTIRSKLLSLGFTDQPLAELNDIARSDENPAARAMASRELALWHMREKTDEGYRTALTHIAAARRTAPDLDFRSKLSVAELLCLHFLGESEKGHAAYDRIALAGEVTPDVMLAWVNFQPTPDLRVTWINQVLRQYDIPPLRLLEDDGRPPYDRLTTVEPLPTGWDGPKVTVLIAAYEAEEMLPTALRSLQEQTWKNLEIIVIDDCSPNPGTCEVTERFAADDPRIRLIRMDQNGGAYVARNRGLDEASGEFVTLHDADDWSHPLKIETQVQFMQDNPEVMGCTSEQARADSLFSFLRLTQSGNLITSNTSSLLWRKAPVVQALGGWDNVRFGADTDFMNRITYAWGKDALVRIPSGPLSFQRNDISSAVNCPATAAESLPYGIRKEYYELRSIQIEREGLYAQKDSNHHACLRMRPQRIGHNSTRRFDVIIASDFRMQGGSTLSSVQEILAGKKFGLHAGIFEMYRYDFPHERAIEAVIRDEIDERNLELLTYGDAVSCDLLILRYPPVLQHRLRYLPKVDADQIRVIVNQPPMSDYTEEGVVRYRLADCAENIRHYFGKNAIWHPIGPLVRDALHTHHAHELHHIDLSPEDWHNIIDINGWDRGPRRRGPSDRLRIGRHSRDHFVKWPATREETLAVYPPSDDVEVHVLGGADVPVSLIGQMPANWTVHPFGSLHPKDFLADIDVFVYFAHPDWVESFGRTIIEAMATGVPVILPEIYRPLFEDAAIYATPQTAVKKARKLHSDPAAYAAQVEKAQRYAAQKFSYEMHISRVRKSIGTENSIL